MKTRYLPPERVDYGLTEDNVGNVIAWIRPDTLADLVSELEQGDVAITLAVLRELETELQKLPSLFRPYATESNSEAEHPVESIG